MCTPSQSNNVTPAATGNCSDGIQNGSEQGVDCGTGCGRNCNGNMNITAATVTYSSGQVASSSGTAGTCFTTNPPTAGGTATLYSTTLITYFYKNGVGTYAYYIGMAIYHSGLPTVGSYTYRNGGSFCLGGVVNQFLISAANPYLGGGCASSTSGTGTLNITNVNTATRKISGNFSATLQCNGNYPISGTFTDVSY